MTPPIGPRRLSLLDRVACCSSSVMSIKLPEGQRQQHGLGDEEHQIEVAERVVRGRLKPDEEDDARQPRTDGRPGGDPVAREVERSRDVEDAEQNEQQR